jgi:hypothetical protein
MSERWKKFGHGDYEVSSRGRIRRATSGGNTYIGKILKQFPRQGYHRVEIHGRWRSVHKIVAKYFIGKRPSGKEINHKDLDKSNNHYKNLEYVTPVKNMEHAAANGHGGTGGKLTPEQHLKIVKSVKRHKGEFGILSKLARKYKVSVPAIKYLVAKKAA